MPRPKLGLDQFTKRSDPPVAPSLPRPVDETTSADDEQPVVEREQPVRLVRGEAGRIKSTERANERKKVKDAIKAEYEARGESLGTSELDLLWLRELDTKKLLTPAQKRKLAEAEGYEARMIERASRSAAPAQERDVSLSNVSETISDEVTQLRQQLEATKIALEEAKLQKREAAARSDEKREAEAARKAAATELAEIKAAIAKLVVAQQREAPPVASLRSNEPAPKPAASKAFEGFTRFGRGAAW